MISIGLTTWREHPNLLVGQKQPTLSDYQRLFKVVELDTFFYGLRPASVVAHWQMQVSVDFKFIIKPPKLLSKHLESEKENEIEQTFAAFRATITPLLATKQLAGILFQFPPAFELTQEAVGYLTTIRHQLPRLPIFVEFRHRSWYEGDHIDQVIAHLRRLQLTLGVIDEPDIGKSSVPLAPIITTRRVGFWRLHGRNAENWAKQGFGSKQGRTLYRYSEEELQDLAQRVQQYSREVEQTYVIFNNNANFDAAPNANRFAEILGLVSAHRPGQQLDLF